MGRRTRHAALVDSLCGRLRAWTAKHAFASRERDPEGRTWYRIENAGAASSTPIDVFIYGEIGFWGVTAEAFLSDLGQVGSRDITLRINSEGGEVFDGVAIYNALQRHPGRIEGHVDGLAASAASFIAMACDELVIEPGAQLMIHDAIGMCYGNASEMRKMVDMLDRTSDTIAAIYAERAGGDAASWRALMSAEDTWYDGPAAVAAGLADRVGEGRDRTGAVKDRQRVAAPVNYYGEAPGERDEDGRFKDGMPSVVASYAIPTVAGSLTAIRTNYGAVQLSNGSQTVMFRPHERARLVRAMHDRYATGDTLITRHEEIDGKLHSVVVARVRPQGSAQSGDGETLAVGHRLDLGAVEDPDDYDTRTGVVLSPAQADGFEVALGNAAIAARVETGYGPLDMYPTSDSNDDDGFGMRMKGDDGRPVEVEFSRAEWQRINRAIDTVIDGADAYDDSATDDTPEINKVTVKTKAGKVDVEWKGGRQAKGYPADARLAITPQDDAAGWSVVIGGEYMSEAFAPIGHINDALGIDNRAKRLTIAAGRQRSAPKRRPRAFRSRPALAWPFAEADGQLRGDDGRWVDMPGTGMSWESYTQIYDVYDESAMPSGIAVVTMSDGEMQLAFDDAEDSSVRHVLLDFSAEDNGPAELRDALREAVDSDTVADFELLDEDGSGVWAVVTRNEESVTLFVPGVVSKNDFEIEVDIDEAEALITAIDEQIDRFNELQDTAGRSFALLTAAWAAPDDWAPPEWAAAHSTPEPVSSSSSDHRSLWEAWA